MEASMKVTGRTIWLTERADSFTLMETSMKASGITTKLMEEEFIFTWMGLNIMVTGEKINNMGMDKRHGLMVLSMRGITSTGRNMEQALSNGLTTVNI
jgi:hypothetical protein